MGARPTVVYYVTPHGFGHATRAAAVAAELEAAGARVLLRTEAPAWLFADEGLAAEVSPAPVDPGMAMKDALEVDRPAALAAHESFLGRWDALAGQERDFLRSVRADAAVSDAGALPVEAAAEAGVPCAVAANFTWDWIVEPWAEEDARWEAVRARMARAYARAAVFLRMPLGGDAPAVARREDIPLVVRRPRLSKAEVLSSLGLDASDPRPLAAFSFGGVGWESAGRAADSLAGWRVLAYIPRPAGIAADWVTLPRRSPVRHCDILSAVDAVLTKPGYGTFSEILAARAPALVVRRVDFRECAPLIASLGRLGRARVLERSDFLAGRWEAGLEALRGAKDPWGDIRLDGAKAAAERILGLA